jgi:hypothetical protein
MSGRETPPPDDPHNPTGGSAPSATNRRGTKRRFVNDRFTMTDIGLGCALWGVLGGLLVFSAAAWILR